MAYTLSYPKVEVEIITEKQNLTARSYASASVDNKNLHKDVLSIVSRREMGADSPTFSVNLVFKDDWYNKIASNDLMIIKLGRTGEKVKPVFFGLVDDKRKSIMMGGGKPHRVISITGRGFSKAFNNFEIGAVKETQVVDPNVGFIAMNLNLASLSASESIKEIIGYYGDVMDYKFGSGETLSGMMDTQLSSRKGEILHDITGIMDFQGSVWNLMKELQNPPFNEMFWEIHDDIPHLIMRETPFSSENWEGLKLHEVDKDKIIDDNTGASDLETYTLYSVGCKSFISDTDPMGTLGYFPLWYPPYFDKYGIKRLNVTSMYSLFADSGDLEEAGQSLRGYTKDLFNWNVKNNVMENGNIVVVGSNRYKIGERLLLKGTDIEYYIEGVTHNFNMFQNWTTTLSVTRGIKSSDRFTSPVGKHEEFDPSVIYPNISNTGNTNAPYKPGNSYEQGRGSFAIPGFPTPPQPGIGSGYVEFPLSGYSYNSGAVVLTSDYGPRWGTFHQGVDYVLSNGETFKAPLRAVRPGTVTRADNKPYSTSGYGSRVDIDHGNGYLSRYSHLDSVYVNKGDFVTTSTIIGTMGNTGNVISSYANDPSGVPTRSERNTGMGAHLHFEIRTYGTSPTSSQHVDPMPYIKRQKPFK